MPIPATDDSCQPSVSHKPLDVCMFCHGVLCNSPPCGGDPNHVHPCDNDDNASCCSISLSSCCSSACHTHTDNDSLSKHGKSVNLSKTLLNCRRDDDAWVDISNARVRNSRFGSLYPGSKFTGIQQCDNLTYDVSVDILHVDLKASTLSGYLNIKGLTPEHPELTTFFEAEIVGPRYSFLTGKWQAQKSIDLSHWSRFPSFAPYKDVFGNDDFTYHPHDQDFVYMRWKERCLVPDHTVRDIDGASFAGFYYICYQRSTGQIKGYYFYLHHTQIVASFQELSLRHVQERSFGNFELR